MKRLLILFACGIASLGAVSCNNSSEPKFHEKNGAHILSDRELDRYAKRIANAPLAEKEALIDMGYSIADSLAAADRSGETLRLFADGLASYFLARDSRYKDSDTYKLILLREEQCEALTPGDRKLLDTKRNILFKNSTGVAIAPIRVENFATGEVLPLTEVVDRTTLLFVYGASCKECTKMTAELKSSSALKAAQEEGSLKLVSLYAGEESAEGITKTATELEGWTNCADYDCSLLTAGAFGPLPLPCIYLLSENGIILLNAGHSVKEAVEVLSEPIPSTVSIALYEGERFWGGRVADGDKMPFAVGFHNTLSENSGNQVQPLLISNKGRYIYSDKPFDIDVQEGRITLSALTSRVETAVVGDNLKDAYEFVCKNYYHYDGSLPPVEFFEKPQYNTWIELQYNQNQADVLRYAQGIIDHGLPPGILMIDDTWMEDYGKWVFHPGRFPDPKAMCDKLHKMGFKIMLWVCPFVSMDQYQIYSQLCAKGALLTTPEGKIYPVEWWNGVSAELDLSNPAAVEWFDEQLHFLMEEYGVDGFKFDAGDFNLWPKDAVTYGGETYYELCSDFSKFGAKYPYNEFRAAWKDGGLPLVERLHDKAHNWESVRRLIPEMTAAGLLGYSFTAPDMVGGGSFASFLPGCKIDQELIVRSAQTHALMPMMQFSVAPWRILDKEHLNAVLKSVKIRDILLPEIVSLIHRAANEGKPVVTPLEYRFPGQGLEDIQQEFMLGDDILVAPMVYPGREMDVVLPEGKWLADDGTIYEGGKTHTISVPLDRIPYFRLQK